MRVKLPGGIGTNSGQVGQSRITLLGAGSAAASGAGVAAGLTGSSLVVEGGTVGGPDVAVGLAGSGPAPAGEAICPDSDTASSAVRVGSVRCCRNATAPASNSATMAAMPQTAALFETEARAVVFDGLADLAAPIDDPALDVTEHDILVLKNTGPRTPAGMPEAGGPLALVESGDRIRMSVAGRTLDLLVDAAVLARRQAPAAPRRGWDRLVAEQILQADEGCDLALLRANG